MGNTLDNEQVPVGLDPCGDCADHGRIVADIDIVVDHHAVLHLHVGGKCRQQYLLGLPLTRLLDRHKQGKGRRAPDRLHRRDI